MNLPFIADKTFKNKDFTTTALPKGEYDNCTFISCDFSEDYLYFFWVGWYPKNVST